MSLNLKHIPCPAGTSCTAFKCIFGHAREKKPLSTSAPEGVSNHHGRGEFAREEKHHRSHDGDDGGDGGVHPTPRKKRKLSVSEQMEEHSTDGLLSIINSGTERERDATSLSSFSSSSDLTRLESIKTADGGPDANHKKDIKEQSPPHDPTSENLDTTSTLFSPESLLAILKDRQSSLKTLQHTPINTKISSVEPDHISTKKNLKAKASIQPTSEQRNLLANNRLKGKPESLNPRLLKAAPASHETRLKLLKMLHQEMERLTQAVESSARGRRPTLTAPELIKFALDEEEQMAVEKRPVYGNVMKQRIITLKRTETTDWQSILQDRLNKSLDSRSRETSPTSSDGGSSSRHKPLTPSPAPTPGQASHSVEKQIDERSAGTLKLELRQRAELLKKLYTPITNLSRHGYVPDVIPESDIKKARHGQEASQGWESCARCSQRFQVFPGRRSEDGALTSKGKCAHHPGRLSRVNKGEERVYSCCAQTAGESMGCTVGECHVFKVTDPARLASTIDFVKTTNNNFDDSVCLGLGLAFDCEMGYTTLGMEVIRLTVTCLDDGKLLIDVLVKPLGEILDLNTRFSGVSTTDFSRAVPWTQGGQMRLWDREGLFGSLAGPATPTKRLQMMIMSFERARDLLLLFLDPDMPLVGHGLENDLNGMRIIHPTVIDTALLFPHHMGLPFRQKLKHLASVHLNKEIQKEDSPAVLGHDSAEDARVAGQLVLHKLDSLWKEMRDKGWRSEKGRLVEPKLIDVTN